MAIRIDGPGRTGGLQGPTPGRRAEGTGATFSLPETNQPSRAAVAPGPLGVGDVASLLALQAVEAPDPRERRRRTVKRGHDLLDVLEAVKLDLLGGGVPVERLERLVGLLGRHEPSGDERLDALVADIELRARVELAKYGRFPE
ncbi:MAG: hypothetical protein GX458_16360 [Phyllobacteriaceae bacterium]|nr:hypothetical protein [Phyllobacteriaceae bacterium]